MKPDSREIYDELVNCLEHMIKVYRQLLNVVRKEREILVSANLDDLNENNKVKETMLLQAKNNEELRLRLTKQLAIHEGLVNDNPRLLDFAVHFDSVDGEKLRNLHSVLELLMRRIKDFNVQNEALVNSALQNITGALNAIRDTLQEKPTYQKQGKISAGKKQAGHLVSREA